MPDQVLVDTSAFYALISSSDKFHAEARRLYERLIESNWQVFTSSYIVVETYSLVHRRLGLSVLEKLHESLREVVEVLWIDRTVHEGAWQSMMENRDKGLSFVDWTTAVIAQQMGIPIFGFDQGFRTAGVMLLA